MNKEQQDKLWNELSEQKQLVIKELYKAYSQGDGAEKLLEGLYGSHNLNPKPKIRTWEDVEKLHEDYYYIGGNTSDVSDALKLKAIATLKIAKLIELGYGGMVTEEEWRNLDIPKYWIEYHPTCQDEKYKFQISCDGHGEAELATEKRFIAFHTPEQREEFMSHSENVELVKQYHML